MKILIAPLFAVILNLFSFLLLNQTAHEIEMMQLTLLFVSDICVSGARVLNCFVKKLFGLFFMAICYFSVDLGCKPPKSLATLSVNSNHGRV